MSSASARNPTAAPWASACYLLLYAAFAAVWPFQVLYYQSRGLSGSQIGFCAAVSTLVSLGAAPLWTGLADSRNRHRAVFVGAGLGTVCLWVLISRAGQFWVLLGLVAAGAVSSSAIVPLIDNSTVAMLGSHSDRYGRIRLWGSVGWGVAAPIAGSLLQGRELSWAYWIGGLTLILGVAASLRVPFSGPQKRESYWNGAKTLLADRAWWFFLSIVFVAGMGHSAYNSYLYAYLDSLGASKGFMGIAQTTATVSELPFFFFAGALLKRFEARGLLIMRTGGGR